MRLTTTWWIFLTALCLITTGVVMVYSASAGIAAREKFAQATKASQGDVADVAAPEEVIEEITSHSAKYLQRQLWWAFIAVAAMLVVYSVDYDTYRKWAPLMVGATFVLCVAVLIPHIGINRKGARRWIGLGPILVQVSDLAKLAMLLYMARQVSERQHIIQSFKRSFLPAMAVLGVFFLLIVKEPDLGAAVMISMVCVAILFVGGTPLRHLAVMGVAAIPVVAVAILSKGYRMQRLRAFMDPEADIHGATFQIHQSLLSVSTGGLWGKGLGEGPQKYQFLAEAYTDFIYAVICEELGMIGGLAILAAYAFFVAQGLRVARRAPDLYGSLVAVGVTTMVGFQGFINIGVVIGLLPTKGLTLPLVSYGGSSLLVNCVAVGILMNVSKAAELAANPVMPELAPRDRDRQSMQQGRYASA